mmetsp:Transcript_24539/g.53747  ORF Transcript_24539/g.53747 Transcript_24539/m.53747 type:complete len:345 (-) Transcript_24539:171-1205(-)
MRPSINQSIPIDHVGSFCPGSLLGQLQGWSLPSIRKENIVGLRHLDGSQFVLVTLVEFPKPGSFSDQSQIRGTRRDFNIVTTISIGVGSFLFSCSIGCIRFHECVGLYREGVGVVQRISARLLSIASIRIHKAGLPSVPKGDSLRRPHLGKFVLGESVYQSVNDLSTQRQCLFCSYSIAVVVIVIVIAVVAVAVCVFFLLVAAAAAAIIVRVTVRFFRTIVAWHRRWHGTHKGRRPEHEFVVGQDGSRGLPDLDLPQRFHRGGNHVGSVPEITVDFCWRQRMDGTNTNTNTNTDTDIVAISTSTSTTIRGSKIDRYHHRCYHPREPARPREPFRPITMHFRMFD